MRRKRTDVPILCPGGWGEPVQNRWKGWGGTGERAVERAVENVENSVESVYNFVYRI